MAYVALFSVTEAKVTALEELTSGMSVDITELQETTEDFESRIQTLEEQISGKLIHYVIKSFSSRCSFNFNSVNHGNLNVPFLHKD